MLERDRGAGFTYESNPFTRVAGGGRETLVYEDAPEPHHTEEAADQADRDTFILVHADQQQLGEIARLLEVGKIRSIAAAVFPLAQARQAYERAGRGTLGQGSLAGCRLNSFNLCQPGGVASPNAAREGTLAACLRRTLSRKQLGKHSTPL